MSWFMRTMYDSTAAGDIPANARMVGGYVDGRYTWWPAAWARFPNAVHVPIAVFASTNNGIVLDVEPGCATPEEAPGWVTMRRAAGIDPSVYCNQSALGTVQAAFNAVGVAQPHYWVARYDNVATIPTGTVAKQYINDPTSGGHYDLSAVVDYWPGVDPAPTTQGDDMPLTDKITVTNGSDVLGETTVGQALGAMAYELTKRVSSRAKLNADPKNTDTLLGRAASADGHSWDNGERIIALAAKLDAMAAAKPAPAPIALTATDLDALADKVAARLATLQFTAAPAASTTTPAP